MERNIKKEIVEKYNVPSFDIPVSGKHTNCNMTPDKKTHEFLSAIMAVDGLAEYIHAEKERIIKCLGHVQSTQTKNDLSKYQVEVIYNGTRFSANGELMLEIIKLVESMINPQPTIEDIKIAIDIQVKQTLK